MSQWKYFHPLPPWHFLKQAGIFRAAIFSVAFGGLGRRTRTQGSINWNAADWLSSTVLLLFGNCVQKAFPPRVHVKKDNVKLILAFSTPFMLPSDSVCGWLGEEKNVSAVINGRASGRLQFIWPPYRKLGPHLVTATLTCVTMSIVLFPMCCRAVPLNVHARARTAAVTAEEWRPYRHIGRQSFICRRQGMDDRLTAWNMWMAWC